MSLKTSEPKVLVPITIEALLVNEHGNSREYASLSPQYAKLRYEVRGEKMVDEPFIHDNEKLEAGIHLHWALPDGLTHGIEQNGMIDFPAVPTRWFVLRMLTDVSNPKHPKIVSKAWVIESDYLDKKKDLEYKRITIPTLDQSQPYHYLGKVYEYEQWNEDKNPETHLGELKAVGPGDPAFAAYYPNCRSVFGFHDADVCNLASGQLTYLVVGWYSDLENDPLFNSDSNNWWDKMENLGWRVEDAQEFLPKQTLCHGLIFNVPWKGISANYQDGVPGQEMEVAIGNTYVEALSALLGSKFASGKDFARLLEVVQYDLISKWGEADGISEVEAKLHERTFGSGPGGTRWVISSTQQKEKESVLPQKIRDAVAELNQLQQEYERVSTELVSLQWETYSVWYRYISEISFLGYLKSLEPQKFEIEIQRLEDEIHRYRLKKMDLAKKVNSLQTDLHNLLCQNFAGYELDKKAGPRFWQAQNPVILLAGEGLQRSFKHGFDHRFDQAENSEGKLFCRVTGQTVRGLKISWQGQDILIAKNDLQSYYQFSSEKLANEVEDLFIESVLLSIDMSLPIANAALSKVDSELTNTAEVSKMLKNCQTIQLFHWNSYLHAELDSLEERVMGVLPSKVGVEIWKAPWTPLFLEWEVCYYPTNSDNTVQGVMKHWNLDGMDYVWTDSTIPQGLDRHYQGSVLLTPSAAIHLKNTMLRVLEHLKEGNPDYDKLKESVQKLGNLQVLAQGLSSFNAELIQRKETLQLEVFDQDYNPTLATKVKELIDEHNDYAPIPYATFNPIRAGFMKVIRLWIVDTFGRVQEVACKSGNPILSEYMKTEGENFANLITLPPRITQPARLSVEWLPTIMIDESQEITPICGWILPNYMDHSVMIYDTVGQLLGSLRLTFTSSGDTRVQWIAPPGSNANDANEPMINDPELAAFVQALRGNGQNGGKVLDDFLMYLNFILSGIDSQISQKELNLAFLMGKPLALVRVSLKLELLGLPAQHQGLDYLGQTETFGFEQIEFPLKFGNATKLHDGLVGYFIKEDVATTYQKMYAVNGVNLPTKSGYIQYDRPLTITCSPKSQGKILTMLIDPTKKIHIRSGILPEKDIQLPEENFKQILSGLDFHFMVEPVLSNSARFSLPLPEINDVEWQFIYKQSLKEWNVVEDIINADATGRFLPSAEQIYEGWLKMINKERKE